MPRGRSDFSVAAAASKGDSGRRPPRPCKTRRPAGIARTAKILSTLWPDGLLSPLQQGTCAPPRRVATRNGLAEQLAGYRAGKTYGIKRTAFR